MNEPTGDAQSGARPAAPRLSRWFVLLAWVIIIGSLLLPPHGASVPLCPSRLVMGIPCPGCGLTRSVTCLAHGELEWSWRYHPFGAVALLLALWFGIVPLIAPGVHASVAASRAVRWIGMTLLVVFVIHGVVRAVLWGMGYEVHAAR